MRGQVTRTHAPAGASCTRWRTAISQVCTSGRPPRTSATRSRIGPTRSIVARMASSVCQAVAMMQRPESLSARKERPTKPSICWTAGITSSRM